MADDIMVLRHGQMIEYGSAEQIIKRPAKSYTKELVAARNSDGAGRDSKNQDIVLEIENVSASYSRSVRVLSDVSLSLARGRTLAVVGESGSGKSTLARVITGLLPAEKGHVSFKGEILPSTLDGRGKETRQKLQMIYQMADTAMNPRHTIKRIIGRPLRFYFGLRGKALEEKVIEFLRMIELDETYLNRYPGELSGGQKQRVCIARALAAKPDLVICDEVTSALDPLVAEEILRLLRTLQERTGVSYFFITHDIETVRAIADDVVVMHRGRIVRSGLKDAVLTPPMDDYTTMLLASVPQMEVGWLESVTDRKSQKAITQEHVPTSSP